MIERVIALALAVFGAAAVVGGVYVMAGHGPALVVGGLLVLVAGIDLGRGR